MCDIFKTIEVPAKGVYKEKGSKFLAFAYPVRDEEAIKEYMATLQKKYHDASHHCFAWRLGPGKSRYRINDDGEPSGTAGKPIYGQLLSRDLTDVLVMVVRYFGGSKLGVSGLIQAYRSAASDALDQSKIIECKVFDRLEIEFAYEQMNQVMRVIKEKHLDFEDQKFDMDCYLVLLSWRRNTKQMLDTFSKIKGCRIRLIEN